MSKVLIFGVHGFVGRYLVHEFLDAGYTVAGSGRCEKVGLPEVEEYYINDILDADAVKRDIELSKPDIVVNLAAISSVGESWGFPKQTMEINVTGSLNILEAVRLVDSTIKVLLIGSSEEYVISNEPIAEGHPLDASNPYGISKVALEHFVNMYRKYYGLKVYYVRAFNHTGIGQRDKFVLPGFCKRVAEIECSGQDGVMQVGNLDVKRDFSHVEDIVRAYRMIVESDDFNLVYNVGSGETHSLREMLEYIISLSSQNIDIEVDKSRFRPTDQPVVWCDRGLIKDRLGWEPKRNVFEALEEMYDYYVKRCKGD